MFNAIVCLCPPPPKSLASADDFSPVLMAVLAALCPSILPSHWGSLEDRRTSRDHFFPVSRVGRQPERFCQSTPKLQWWGCFSWIQRAEWSCVCHEVKQVWIHREHCLWALLSENCYVALSDQQLRLSEHTDKHPQGQPLDQHTFLVCVWHSWCVRVCVLSCVCVCVAGAKASVL